MVILGIIVLEIESKVYGVVGEYGRFFVLMRIEI